MQKEKRRRPRLEAFSYQGPFAYSVTLCTHRKIRAFISDTVVSRILEILMERAYQQGFSLLAYCFMPDHLHLLILGKEETADLRDLIRTFKQKAGYWYRQTYKVSLWQPSYYDHVLRREEGVKAAARYIVENPIRSGLVENVEDYPYSGSAILGMEGPAPLKGGLSSYPIGQD